MGSGTHGAQACGIPSRMQSRRARGPSRARRTTPMWIRRWRRVLRPSSWGCAAPRSGAAFACGVRGGWPHRPPRSNEGRLRDRPPAWRIARCGSVRLPWRPPVHFGSRRGVPVAASSKPPHRRIRPPSSGRSPWPCRSRAPTSLHPPDRQAPRFACDGYGDGFAASSVLYRLRQRPRRRWASAPPHSEPTSGRPYGPRSPSFRRSTAAWPPW